MSQDELRPFIKTPVGIMMLINIVILTVTWCLMLGWRFGEDPLREWTREIDEKIYFFLLSTIAAWLIMIALFVTFFCGRCRNKTCSVLMVILGGVLGALVLVAGAFIALEAKSHPCDMWNCRMVDATAAFGFLSTIGLVVQAFMYFFLHIFKS